jgi:hypothetical protein
MNTQNLNRYAGFAALYMATSYILGIVVFLFILDYPNIEEDEKVGMLDKFYTIQIAANFLMYIVFGLVLLLFTIMLYENIKHESVWPRVFLGFGVMWSLMLIVSGMIANAGINATLELSASSPDEAARFWRTVELVSGGIGGAYGEIVGGMFSLSFSLSAWKTSGFPRALNYLGVAVGIVGCLSTVPVLKDLTGMFGIAQIVWFLWVGKTLLSTKSSGEPDIR